MAIQKVGFKHDDADPHSLFMGGFGALGLKHKTTYCDPLGVGEAGVKVDARPGMANYVRQKAALQRKAMTTETGGAGTASYALVPVSVDPLVVDQSRKFTPIQEIIPKVTNMGLTADYNIITAKGAADFLAEDASLSDQNDTYDRASTAIKYCYSVGRITGPAEAAIPPYLLDSASATGSGFVDGGFNSGSAPTGMQLEVLVKARALAEAWEEAVVNGNTSTDSAEFDGIVQIQSTTNQLDLDGANLTMSDVKTAVRYAYDDGGRPNLAICDSDTFTDIELLLEDYSRSPPTTDIFGVQYPTLRTMVGDVPVIPSPNLSTTSGAKQLFFLDLSVWEQRMLMDTTFDRLGKTNDSDKFFLKRYGTLICKATNRNAFVDNIG